LKAVEPTALSEDLTEEGGKPDIGPRVYGVIDVIRPERLAGWAIDRSDDTAAVEVDVYREGEKIATVTANRPRKDLQKGGVGTGCYGFSADLDPPIDTAFGFTLNAIARTEDGVSASLKHNFDPDQSSDTKVQRRILEDIIGIKRGLKSVQTQLASQAFDRDASKLTEMIERLEVMQARIEAAASKSLAAPVVSEAASAKPLAYLALAIALASLGLGAASIFGLW
jgi:hypothetical protein